MLDRGIKKQVFGGVLFCLGAMTVLLSRTIGFEPDRFYIVIIVIGACLFLYGVIQTKKQILTSDPEHFGGSCTEPDTDTADGIQLHRTDDVAEDIKLASHSASRKQSVPVHGN